MNRLVFVHGSGHTHESFSAQVEAFPGSDAVSLPGHPEGQALTSVGDCAVWLQKYLHWKGASKPIVAGNSLGGAIALEWALRYPADAGGLILLGTGARLRVAPAIFSMIDADWPACIETLVSYSVSKNAGAGLRDRVAGWHHVVGRASTRQDYADCDAFDAMDRIGTIDVPAMIVVGAEDVMTPLKYSTFLHDALKGSSLHVIDGAGHLAHAEKPETVNDLIRRTFAGALA
jgi:pimeloyl-ACP methyl ester carboxylesterase